MQTQERFIPAVYLCLIMSLVACLATAPANADQGWEGHSFHLTWENDATRGSDRHYTQGARLTYLSSDDAAPPWLRKLSDRIPTAGYQSQAIKFSLEVGQEIYTPEDLNATDVVRDDHPYAGWLYGRVGLIRRGTGRLKIPVMEQFQLALGVVGPESKAEQTQKVWHGKDPRGWDNQLQTEPGLILRYERSYLVRFQGSGPWAVDIVPGTDLALGNVDTHLGAAAMFRAGCNIPNRFEAPGQKTPKKFGAYIFGGGGGRLVGRNIFLDGNTWRSSHSVDKHFLNADASVGIAIVLKFAEISASNNYRTRQFRGQRQADSYGSATVSFKF